MLKVGVVSRINEPTSISLYRHYVSIGLKNMVEFVDINPNLNEFSEKVQLLWDPSLGMRPILPIHYSFRPVVVTIHGIRSFCISSEEFGYNEEMKLHERLIHEDVENSWKGFRNLVDRVIVVSNSLRDDICRHLKIQENKITVIHHGCHFKNETVDVENISLQLPNKYFLHVSEGSAERKNLNRIIEAFNSLQDNDFYLLIKTSQQILTDSDRVIIINRFLPEEELKILYKKASAFLFPSLYESFGMPILEAFASHCPVITSNTFGCREIGGEGAFLVNPYSVDSIRSAMEIIIIGGTVVYQKIKTGHKRVKHFSWEKSAASHFKVFKDIVELYQ